MLSVLRTCHIEGLCCLSHLSPPASHRTKLFPNIACTLESSPLTTFFLLAVHSLRIHPPQNLFRLDLPLPSHPHIVLQSVSILLLVYLPTLFVVSLSSHSRCRCFLIPLLAQLLAASLPCRAPAASPSSPSLSAVWFLTAPYTVVRPALHLCRNLHPCCTRVESERDRGADRGKRSPERPDRNGPARLPKSRERHLEGCFCSQRHAGAPTGLAVFGFFFC